MTDEFKPPPEIKKIVFDESVFHPLDHWPWQCDGYPGGWRNHLKMTWEFRRRGQLRAATFCKVGLHENTQWFQRDRATGVQMTWRACINCMKPCSERQPV